MSFCGGEYARSFVVVNDFFLPKRTKGWHHYWQYEAFCDSILGKDDHISFIFLVGSRNSCGL